MTSAEVEKKLQKYIGGLADEAKPEGGTEKYPGGANDGAGKKPAPTNSNESAKAAGTRSIDDAFADMVGESA
jgi:hypothetical protein